MIGSSSVNKLKSGTGKGASGGTAHISMLSLITSETLPVGSPSAEEDKEEAIRLEKYELKVRNRKLTQLFFAAVALFCGLMLFFQAVSPAPVPLVNVGASSDAKDQSATAAPPLVSQTPLVVIPDSNGWTYIGMRNRILVHQRAVQGSPLRAFKGEALCKAHISTVLHSFYNASHTLRWADKLHRMEVLDATTGSNNTGVCAQQTNLSTNKSVPIAKKPTSSKEGEVKPAGFFKMLKNALLKPIRSLLHIFIRKSRSTHLLEASPVANNDSQCAAAESSYNDTSSNNTVRDVVYQLYAMWPLPSRDFVFARESSFDHDRKVVSIRYKSVQDDRRKEAKHVVRTSSPFTNWKFQPLSAFCQQQASNHTFCTDIAEEERKLYTLIDLETFVELEDMGFSWLVNYIQSSWPVNTLTAFSKVLTSPEYQQQDARFAAW